MIALAIAFSLLVLAVSVAFAIGDPIDNHDNADQPLGVPPMDHLVEVKQAFVENQLPALEREIAAFIAAHPVLRDLPERDQRNAAHCAATHLLLAIRSQSVVEMVR